MLPFNESPEIRAQYDAARAKLNDHPAIPIFHAKPGLSLAQQLAQQQPGTTKQPQPSPNQPRPGQPIYEPGRPHIDPNAPPQSPTQPGRDVEHDKPEEDKPREPEKVP